MSNYFIAHEASDSIDKAGSLKSEPGFKLQVADHWTS